MINIQTASHRFTIMVAAIPDYRVVAGSPGIIFHRVAISSPSKLKTLSVTVSDSSKPAVPAFGAKSSVSTLPAATPSA